MSDTGKLDLDQITSRMRTDKEYANRMVKDYNFAKSEFAKANVVLDQDSHRKIADGINALRNAFGQLHQTGLEEKPMMAHISVSFP
jgi:hypothetical protein